MLGEIIAIYAITDDLLKAIGHREDMRAQLSDNAHTEALPSSTQMVGERMLA